MEKIKKIAIIIIILIVVLLACEFIAYENSNKFGAATLSWNASADSDLAGYKIYYGASPRTGNCPKESGYSNNIDVGNVVSYTIAQLENNKTYYFSVSAYDKSKNESCFGVEVNKTIEVSKPNFWQFIFRTKK